MQVRIVLLLTIAALLGASNAANAYITFMDTSIQFLIGNSRAIVVGTPETALVGRDLKWGEAVRFRVERSILSEEPMPSELSLHVIKQGDRPARKFVAGMRYIVFESREGTFGGLGTVVALGADGSLGEGIGQITNWPTGKAPTTVALGADDSLEEGFGQMLNFPAANAPKTVEEFSQAIRAIASPAYAAKLIAAADPKLAESARWEPIYELSLLKVRSAVPLLQRLAGDPNLSANLRCNALGALFSIAPARADGLARQALDTATDFYLAQESLSILGRRGVDAKFANDNAPVLVRALARWQGGDAQAQVVTIALLRLLARGKQLSPGGELEIMSCIHFGSETVRHEALETAGVLGIDAIVPLVFQYAELDPYGADRRYGCNAVGQMMQAKFGRVTDGSCIDSLNSCKAAAAHLVPEGLPDSSLSDFVGCCSGELFRIARPGQPAEYVYSGAMIGARSRYEPVAVAIYP